MGGGNENGGNGGGNGNDGRKLGMTNPQSSPSGGPDANPALAVLASWATIDGASGGGAVPISPDHPIMRPGAPIPAIAPGTLLVWRAAVIPGMNGA